MRTFLAIALVPALLVAGCVDAPQDVDAASTDAALATILAPTHVPFTWDGAVSPAVYACPVVTCAGWQLDGMYSPLSPEGDITALSLTMTWDAVAPTTETLRLGVAWGEDSYEFVDGTSPLVLELANVSIARAKDPYVWVWIPGPAMGLATVGTPQDFHVEGTTTQLASDAVAAMQGSERTSILIEETGSFGTMAVACVAPVTCAGQSVSPSDRIFPQADARGAVDVALVAAWDATSPATEQMILGVFTCVDGCRSDAEVTNLEYVYGPSPLSLDVSGFEVPQGEVLFVYVQQGGTGVPMAYALVTVPQEFSLSGTLSVEA